MKIRSLCAAILGSMMLADNAFALSCMRPDLVKTLEEAKASEKLYYVLVGKFVPMSPPPKHQPYGGYTSPEDQFKSRPPVITRSYFEGYSVAKHARRDGHLTRFPVDIETSCVASWCSSAPPADREVIAFVQARPGQAPILEISPCPSLTFAATTPQVQKIRQCLDKSCEPEAVNWK
ncbi:MAG: hypothetical protein ABJN69_05175 [Hellea sp.]